MKTLFIIHNPVWASARLRARWIARYMDDAGVITGDEYLRSRPQAARYIFVKQGEPELFKELRASGSQVWIDWCDPGWWGSPDIVHALSSLVDGIVVSNEPLADDLRGEIGTQTPIYCIPDRIEPECYPMRREHADVTPIRFIWFGAFQNRVSLFGWSYLEKLAGHGYPIALTVCDDQPNQPWSSDFFPVYHVKWEENRENEIYASHDIAYLPTYPGPWGRVKSNNKAVTATLCGLPVADGMNWGHLRRLVESPEYRTQTVATQAVMYSEFMDLRKSAAEWERLLG